MDNNINNVSLYAQSLKQREAQEIREETRVFQNLFWIMRGIQESILA